MDSTLEATVVGWADLRGGGVAYVFSVEPSLLPEPFGPNPYPVVGRIAGSDEEHRWTLDGRYDEGGPHPWDIIRRRV
jgi:hypothetical protein